MANGLGMTTTAEGVETEEQLETVSAEGCTEMQGFLFSQPLPAHEIEQLYFPDLGKEQSKPARRCRETHCLSLRAQPLDKLGCGIGVCRQAQFHLRRLDAGACGGAELAVDLAHFDSRAARGAAAVP